MSYTYKHPMCSATATMVVFHNDKVLLGLRSSNEDNISEKAYPGYWSLPGGFMNAKHTDEHGVFHPGERLEDTAIRELIEETNIYIDEEQLELFRNGSKPNADPRAHVVNACYYIFVEDKQIENMFAGDDLDEIKFVSYDEALNTTLAFDHHTILVKALEKIGYLKK